MYIGSDLASPKSGNSSAFEEPTCVYPVRAELLQKLNTAGKGNV